MILQTSKGLRDEIRKWGCYFMSLLYLINHLTNMTMSQGQIHKLYRLFLLRGWMSKSCRILDPNSILAWAGIEGNIIIRNGTHKLPPDYQAGENEYEILEFQIPGDVSHFVVGPYDGRRVGYDPWGPSKSVRYGRLVSKRVFRIESVHSYREAA